MKKINFVNLTPHPLTLQRPDRSELVIQPDENGPARVSVKAGVKAGELNEVPLYTATLFGEIVGLPAPQIDTIYIVSGMVGGQIRNRGDVVVPGTGPADGAVRNEQGHIIAVTRLNKVC